MKYANYHLLILIAGWLCLCSTEPEIDYNKLDDNYFISCTLPLIDTTNTTGITQNTIILSISRLRYLVEYAFADEEDRLFSVRSARVTITGNGVEYNLISNNRGEFKYTFQNAEETIKPDQDYTLNIRFADKSFTSQLHSPMVTIEQKDTIWIYPDSVLTWSNPENWWDYKTPLSVSNEFCFKDTVRYTIPKYSELIGYGPEPHYYNNEFGYRGEISEHLWIKFDTTSSSLIISTACDSPSVFLKEFVQDSAWLRFGCSHKYSGYFSEYFSDPEEHGILNNLEDYSNISGEGGYGIFTVENYSIPKQFIIKVKSQP